MNTRVTRRSTASPARDRLDTSEYYEQVFGTPGRREPRASPPKWVLGPCTAHIVTRGGPGHMGQSGSLSRGLQEAGLPKKVWGGAGLSPYRRGWPGGSLGHAPLSRALHPSQCHS